MILNLDRMRGHGREYVGIHGCREVLSRAGTCGGKSTFNCRCLACKREHVANSVQLNAQSTKCSRGCTGLTAQSSPGF